jgi:tetratricopeptide (TPR) repeat protein
LEARGEQLLEKAIIDTGEAISNSVLSTALSASQLASAIAPDNKTVLHLVQRTATLPTVIDAMQRGNQLLALQRYDQAAIAFREATLADPEHQKAAAALTSTEQQITEQRFLGHMSDGFKALDKDNFELAIAAFNRAATVYADNPAVEQALAQVETRRSQLWVSNSIAQAAEFEQQERWQKALEIYQQLLATDATLTDIKVKLIPVSVRADLDTRITKVLSDPLALSAISHYRHGQKVLQDATGIANPGPLLSQQITQLNHALKASQTPIEVTLVSDSNTDVTLFKVARLGSFDKTAVSLKPGRYIVAGSRMGYRDVRIEFTLTDQGLDEPIAVSCTELI